MRICELFRNPAAWNGRMIRVRAAIRTWEGGETEPSLSGSSCTTKIKIKGHEFLNEIHLQIPEDQKLRAHDVNFRWDDSSFGRFVLLLQEVDRKNQHICATVIGMFETRTPLPDLIQEKRPFPDNGFGHLGWAPAQILVKTMRDMRIEPNSGKGPDGPCNTAG